MTNILENDDYKTVVELSSTYQSGYRWLSASRLLAQMSGEGILLCRIDASDSEHPVTRLELTHGELDGLIEAYESRIQAIASRPVSEDLGDIDDHPF